MGINPVETKVALTQRDEQALRSGDLPEAEALVKCGRIIVGGFDDESAGADGLGDTEGAHNRVFEQDYSEP